MESIMPSEAATFRFRAPSVSACLLTWPLYVIPEPQLALLRIILQLGHAYNPEVAFLKFK